MCSLSIFSSKSKLPNTFKKSLLSLLIFIVLFYVCDRGFYFVLNAAFHCTTTLDKGGIVNKVLQEKCDIVVLGSSRAVLHYDPRILGSKLNMSAYNAGCNGQQVHYTRALVDLILQKQTPAIAIINVDTGFVMGARFNLCQAATLAPFMDASGIIKNMIYSKGPFEKLKYLSLSYRFNDKPLVILASLLFEDKTISGFSPREGKLDPAKAQEKITSTLEPDREMMKLLRQTVSQLKGAGSYVVLVLSPTWSKEGRIDPMRIAILRAIRDLAQDEQVSFLAVTNENTPEFQNSEYFRDPDHLNADGARIFSEILAAKIAGLMENQFQNVYDDI